MDIPTTTTPRFHLTDEELAEGLARQATALANGKPRTRRKRKGIEYFKFPAYVIQAVRLAGGSYHSEAVIHTMCAIYDVRYSDYDHPQTIRLTNAALTRYGVSRRQKVRALRVLERSGQYAVEWDGDRKNPLVTEIWRPVWK